MASIALKRPEQNRCRSKELSFSSLHFGNVYVEEADRIALEALSLRLVALDVGQAGDAVPLKTSVQRRPAQVWDRRLQCVKAVIQWQQSVTPKCNDRRLFGFGQCRRMRGLRPGLHILDCRPLAPLRDRLRVDPQLPAQRRERSLRSLYCCSDGVRGRGAPVTNLSHMASFHSNERIAPSNRGIKQLGSGLID